MIRILTIILGLSWWLGGCASWDDIPLTQPPQYQVPLQLDANYTVDGRFAITTLHKSYYGNFNWQHDSESDTLALVSPLGTTFALIQVESGLASLTTKNEHYQGADLDQLLNDNLGFVVPLNYLHYWIQGVPFPNYPITTQLAAGFSQLKWQVEYLRWHDRNHPQLIQLTQQHLKIKLLVNWPDAESTNLGITH